MMRVKWIDGAKGIAILMVIVIHLAQVLPWLPKGVFWAASFGAMGVQLFFLMSAYCLCMTWRPDRFDGFYWWRKYKRLIGWYAVGIVLYYLYWLWHGDAKMVSAYTVGNVLANLLFVHGFMPAAQNSIVPGGWSISCIALFVFAYPVLARWSVRRQIVILAVASAVGGVVSLIGYVGFGWSRFYSYCVPFNQLAPFTLGIVFWHNRESLKTRFRPLGSAVAFVLFFIAAVASVALTREYAIFYRQILVSLSFVFGLLLLERYERIVPNWLVWVGRHSYEIFIVHFLAIWLVFR